MSAIAPPPEAPAVATPTAPKSGKLLKLIALAFVVAVIGGECLVAFFYLTSKDHGAGAHAEEHATKPAHGEQGGEPSEELDAEAYVALMEEEAGGDHGQAHEVDLGEFSLTVFQPSTNTTLLVDFHLYGTIRHEEEVEFTEMFEKNKHRIRDQIIVTIRSAELQDLADPGLGLIKRQILAKSNAILGKLLLRAVIFSDFTFIEQ